MTFSEQTAEYAVEWLPWPRECRMLMGSAVPPRKRFIQTHARQVRNLDT